MRSNKPVGTKQKPPAWRRFRLAQDVARGPDHYPVKLANYLACADRSRVPDVWLETDLDQPTAMSRAGQGGHQVPAREAVGRKRELRGVAEDNLGAVLQAGKLPWRGRRSRIAL